MKWVRLVIIATLLLPIWAVPVQASTSEEVVVTATGYVCEAPGGFTVTYISDYEVGLSWTKGEDAVNTMVRAAIGRAPVDRTDGYLVYYGEDESATDWVNMETLSVPIFYTGWSEDSLGRWEEEGGTTGFVEGLGMIMIGFIALAVSLFGFSLHFRKTPLAIGAGMAWVGLGVYSLSRASGAFDIWNYLGWVGIAMAFCSFFLMWWLREKPEPEEEVDEAEEYEQSLRHRVRRAGLGARRRRESRSMSRFERYGEG